MIYSINIQQTLKPCEHAVHIMLFEGHTQVVKQIVVDCVPEHFVVFVVITII